MNAAYASALAALAGSAIGAIASFATTWLTQNRQDLNQRQALGALRRERLYGEFIDEAARLFADAMGHSLDDSSKLVQLYAIRSKMRLFAPEEITDQADIVLQRVVEVYGSANLSAFEMRNLDRDAIDILRGFTERCREDLRG